MKRVKYLLLLPLVLLTGCVNGQIDLVQMTKNPIVMLIIGGLVLYIAFKQSGKK